MQTVDHSSHPTAAPPAAPTEPVRRPDLRALRDVTVKPVVPRGGRPLPGRSSLQDAEDGGEAEAHPS